MAEGRPEVRLPVPLEAQGLAAVVKMDADSMTRRFGHASVYAALPILLSGCHRQIMRFGFIEWLVIGGVSLFVLIVFLFDLFLEEQGFRITPAPHIGMNEPTTIQALVAHEADKQQEQAGAPK